MQLEGYISDLLYHQNCIIVPDFGGFVTNYKSALIDELHKKIYPPSKSVLFNPQLKSNDGLLGNYVAQEQQVEYSTALNFIADEVVRWKEVFKKGERIEFDEIGFLYREDDKVYFEQSREVNLLLQAFGLTSIDFVSFSKQTEPAKASEKIEVIPKVRVESEQKIEEKSVLQDNVVIPQAVIEVEKVEETKVIRLDAKQAIEQVEAEKIEENQIVPIKRKRRGLVIMKYAAAIAFVPLLFYSYWIPMETDALETSSIQFKDFNPIHEQAESIYSYRKEGLVDEPVSQVKSWSELTANVKSDVYNLEVAEDFYVSVLLTETTDLENVEVDNTSTQGTTNEHDSLTTESGAYHVISGCFSVKSNAENLVKELQSEGFSARILDKKGGLHRVTAGDFSNRNQAENGLSKVKNSGYSAWILKK